MLQFTVQKMLTRQIGISTVLKKNIKAGLHREDDFENIDELTVEDIAETPRKNADIRFLRIRGALLGDELYGEFENGSSS